MRVCCEIACLGIHQSDLVAHVSPPHQPHHFTGDGILPGGGVGRALQRVSGDVCGLRSRRTHAFIYDMCVYIYILSILIVYMSCIIVYIKHLDYDLDGICLFF